MKRYALIGLGLFYKGIAIVSLRLTTTILRYLGVIIEDEEKVYSDNT